MAFNFAAALRHLFNVGAKPQAPSPKPSPATFHTVTVRVNEPSGVAVAGATITLWWADGPTLVTASDAFGRAFFQQIPDLANPAVNVKLDGYVTWQEGIGSSHDVQVAFVATAAKPLPLVVSGRRMLKPDGSPAFLVGLDGFTTLQDLMVAPPKADALLGYLDAVGGHFLRVFGMFNGGIGRFIPAEYPGYMAALATLATRLRDKGKYLYFTTNADCQNAPLSFDPAFFDRIAATLRPFADSVFLDGGNEFPFNGFDPKRLTQPAGFIAGAASVGGGYQPLHDPLWSFAAWQCGRSDQWERTYKDQRDQFMGDNTDGQQGSPPAFAFHCAIIEDETIGHGDVSEAGRTNADPYKTFTYFAGAKMMGSTGVCVHQRSGIFGDVPATGGFEDLCVRAAVEAGNLPLGAHAFDRYERGNSPDQAQNPNLPVLHFDLEPSPSIGYPGNPNGSLRTHAMISADGRSADVVAPGAGPGYVAQAANGWRIVESYRLPGHPANVLRCAR